MLHTQLLDAVLAVVVVVCVAASHREQDSLPTAVLYVPIAHSEHVLDEDVMTPV